MEFLEAAVVAGGVMFVGGGVLEPLVRGEDR